MLANTSATVELHDSAAQPLYCNFVSIQSVSSLSSGGWVELHASSLSLSEKTYGMAPSYPQEASGLLMVACPAAGGVAQLALGGADAVSSVGVVNRSLTPGGAGDGATGPIIITYGNVMTGNSLKDNQRARGD